MKLTRPAAESFGACCDCPGSCGYRPDSAGYCAPWAEYCGGISSGCCRESCAPTVTPKPKNIAPAKKTVVRLAKKLFMAALPQLHTPLHPLAVSDDAGPMPNYPRFQIGVKSL